MPREAAGGSARGWPCRRGVDDVGAAGMSSTASSMTARASSTVGGAAGTCREYGELARDAGAGSRRTRLEAPRSRDSRSAEASCPSTAATSAGARPCRRCIAARASSGSAACAKRRQQALGLDAGRDRQGVERRRGAVRSANPARASLPRVGACRDIRCWIRGSRGCAAARTASPASGSRATRRACSSST